MVDTRTLVFDRLQADFLIRGEARVSWRLFRLFTDPPPHSFQLQYSESNISGADDWVNCGPPQVDAAFAVDAVRRGFGKHHTGSYRVLLTTGRGSYASRPIALSGLLQRHDWLIAREVLRTNKLRFRVAAGVGGWLFRRRHSGETPPLSDPRTSVLNAIDRSLVNSQDTRTYGTPFVNGYFAPVPVFFEVTPASHREMIGEMGTQDPAGIAVEGIIPALPEVTSLDVFVADGSDRRFYIHAVRNIAEWRGVPLLSRVELRVAPANDPVYELPLVPQYSDALINVTPLAGAAAMSRWRAYRS